MLECKRPLVLAVSILVVSISQARISRAISAQVVLHVSSTGDDTVDGSASNPLRSLHGAQKRVRKLLAENRARTIRVEISQGDYFLEKPLVLTPDDSGKSWVHNITYAAAEQGKVRISGGRTISGWHVENGHWVTHVPLEVVTKAADAHGNLIPPFRDLWVNGRRAVRARTPNVNFFRIEQAGPDNRTSFSVRPRDLLTLANPNFAEIVFLHDWSLSRVCVQTIDLGSGIYHFTDPIGADYPHFKISYFEPHPRYFIENSPEFIDVPGEWFLDVSTGRLEYIPREGETLQTAAIVAPFLDRLLIFRGQDREHPVSHVHFEGLVFSHTRLEIPSGGYAGIQSCFHLPRKRANESDGTTLTGAVSPAAAVTLSGADDCRFMNCRFEHLGGCGVHLKQSHSSHIDRCHFRDVGGNGIMIGRSTSSTEPTETDRSPSPFCDNNRVTHCLVEECGKVFYGAVGVWVGFASNTSVKHNEICGLPYSGVSVGWRWDNTPTDCHDNHIVANHIHHIMQMLSDGAGIYTLGRQPGTMLSENVIHDVSVNAGRAESNGVFMDEGSTGIKLHNNTIYNIARSPVRFNSAGKNSLLGNQLVTQPGIPIFRYNGTKPGDMAMSENEEITSESWRPADDDQRVRQAGPQPRS